MKSFTDLEQSKKLAEILSIESADIYYTILTENSKEPSVFIKRKVCRYSVEDGDIPCWSLAALIGVLPRYLKYTEGECPLQLLTLDFENPHRKDHCWIVGYWDYDEEYEKYNFQIEAREEEVIDACYELVLKLHEHKLLKEH